MKEETRKSKRGGDGGGREGRVMKRKEKKREGEGEREGGGGRRRRGRKKRKKEMKIKKEKEKERRRRYNRGRPLRDRSFQKTSVESFLGAFVDLMPS